jgi:ferritin-like metal-binding protein YciE
MGAETLQELLVEELKDLYDAEKQLVRALPKMTKAASDPELQDAFREHTEVTKNQVERLEQIFELLGERAKGKPCKGMKGLVEEGQEVIEEHDDERVLDAAIIGAAQKVEHYEMAGYGTARTFAQRLGLQEAAGLLQETLDEEGQADKQLTAISKRLLKETGRAKPEAKSGRNGGARNGKSARTTTDHDEIRRWAAERGAQPACVRGTGDKGDIGMLRIDFPGYSGAESLEHISWDEWFEKFDENNLALLYQEKTTKGQKSNFNKLVSRSR